MKINETPIKKNKRLQLDQTQVTLLLSFMTVGLVLVFGAGFITGMWYQTNEASRSLHLESATQPLPPTSDADKQMTFYTTLTRSQASSAAGQSDPKEVNDPQPPSHTRPSRQIPPATQPAALKVRYRVQVGSFRARDEAEHLNTVLSNKGYTTVIKTALVSGKGIVYRVMVGQFAERDAANHLAHRLQSRERLAVMITSDAP
jgi:cell division protein FtsN